MNNDQLGINNKLKYAILVNYDFMDLKFLLDPSKFNSIISACPILVPFHMRMKHGPE